MQPSRAGTGAGARAGKPNPKAEREPPHDRDTTRHSVPDAGREFRYYPGTDGPVLAGLSSTGTVEHHAPLSLQVARLVSPEWCTGQRDEASHATARPHGHAPRHRTARKPRKTRVAAAPEKALRGAGGGVTAWCRAVAASGRLSHDSFVL